ncbi:hypothetical protein FRC07_006815 [Ceratobasidium sp. 392]|nr:hypothetical protein FRC07_006815 [Ceratobasidium sp. 392]
MTVPSVDSFHDISAFSSSPEELSDAEKRWVSFQPYLLSKGYQLRPRYRPGWVPSWKSTGAYPYDCEDSSNALPLRVLDAIRLEDGYQVIIKMLVPSDNDREGEQELEILQVLSTATYQFDPTNHTVPFFDSFPIPGIQGGVFCIMPLLSRYRVPRFYDLSEIHEFLDQIFEGLEFLHKHNIAHCDIASPNIMMNGHLLYDEPFHPYNQHLSLDTRRSIYPSYLRSQRPIRYYYIDFGYAKWFRDPQTPRLVTGSRAREPAPEQFEGKPYDPFKADIYQLGAIIRRDLVTEYSALHFLLPLARGMTETDPTKRPTLAQAHRTINAHFAQMLGVRKRWPMVPPEASLKDTLSYNFAGVMTEMLILLRRAIGPHKYGFNVQDLKEFLCVDDRIYEDSKPVLPICADYGFFKFQNNAEEVCLREAYKKVLDVSDSKTHLHCTKHAFTESCLDTATNLWI